METIEQANARLRTLKSEAEELYGHWRDACAELRQGVVAEVARRPESEVADALGMHRQSVHRMCRRERSA